MSNVSFGIFLDFFVQYKSKRMSFSMHFALAALTFSMKSSTLMSSFPLRLGTSLITVLAFSVGTSYLELSFISSSSSLTGIRAGGSSGVRGFVPVGRKT
jgi:hypothetical protein